MAYQLFLESFDTVVFSVTGSSLTTNRWLLTSGSNQTVSTSPSNGRRSSNSLRFSTVAGGSTTATKNITTSTHTVIGFWVKSNFSTGTSSILFRKGTTTLVTVIINANGIVSVTLAGTTYNSTNQLPSSGVYVEIGLVVSDNGSLEIRVNGSSAGWINLSGVDTKPGTDINIDNIRISTVAASSPTFVIDYDDLYITYGDELKWLGDIRVDAFALNGNATPQDWVPDTGNAWERLNQAAGNVKSNIINAESLFSVANISFDTPEVHGVQIGIIANKTDSGQRNMVIQANNNNITTNSSIIGLGTSNTEYLYSLTKDTDGANWTKQRFNDLKVGIKVVE